MKCPLAEHQGADSRGSRDALIEQLEDVPKMMSQNRIQRRTAEQLVDMPVPKMVEEPVFEVLSQDRVRQRFVEKNIEYPVDESFSQCMEESVEVVKTVFQERISERICEQDGVIKVSKISSQDRKLQRTRQTPMAYGRR